MKTGGKAHLVFPILIILVGVGWLLTVQGYAPEINWLWTLGLAVIGLLTFLGGFNKFSVVVGPFFLLASGLSVLRQTGGLRLEIEVPVLVISAGVLLLIAQLPAIPAPAWYEPPREESETPKKQRL